MVKNKITQPKREQLHIQFWLLDRRDIASGQEYHLMFYNPVMHSNGALTGVPLHTHRQKKQKIKCDSLEITQQGDIRVVFLPQAE